MTYKKSNAFLVFLCGILFTVTANAQIKLPQIIADNMILQRNAPVPVWGWAKAGYTVKVSFAGRQKSAVADASGYWKVVFNKMTANDHGQQMTITSDTSTVKLNNILIGEVWFCSGQSNMEYTMKLGPSYVKPAKGIDSSALELAVTTPNIRLFKVEKVYSLPDVTTKGWNESGGAALEQFSAVGYYRDDTGGLGRQPYRTLDIAGGICC